jgi:FtsP/CotA-like multicopper oxidase with cupredoxin domain
MKFTKWSSAAIFALALNACHHGAPAVSTTPAVDSPGIALAVDENPDPHIFEFHLEARVSTTQLVAGTTTTVWSYNGTVPGPLIDATVGDTLVVHFKNSLPESTTIHWHGIRLPNEMDGTLAVQRPVKPGGTFEYRFTLKDAGLYWFHPHQRSDAQTARGLYGVIRVRGPHEPVVDAEHVVVLDDARLESDGSLPADLTDYALLPFPMKVHGRCGPNVLVNGQTKRTLTLRPGAIHRFRFLNTANLRYFNLAVAGHRWRVIGTDGSLLPKPYDVDHLVIGPAERYDALLIPSGAPGADLTLVSDAFARAEDDPQPATSVATFHLEGDPIVGRVLPSELPNVAVPRIVVPTGEPTLIEFDSDTVGGSSGYTLPPMDMAGEPVVSAHGDPIFVINKKAGTDVPPLAIPLGTTRAFRVHNVSHQIHIFHLHGFFFQIVDTDDVYDAVNNPGGLHPEMTSQAVKDTITVRSGYSVTIVGTFDAPGKWMFHCHIPEHSERGMMGEIDVGQ